MKEGIGKKLDLTPTLFLRRGRMKSPKTKKSLPISQKRFEDLTATDAELSIILTYLFPNTRDRN